MRAWIVPSGNVSAMISTQAMKTRDVMTVSLSRFFSQMPEPAEALYMEEAMSSETPVPLPECMRMRMQVAMPDRNRSTTRMMLRTLTDIAFPTCRHAAHQYSQLMSVTQKRSPTTGRRGSARNATCSRCYIAAFTIAAKESALSDAPPTSAPSTSSFSRKPATLFGFAEPP